MSTSRAEAMKWLFNNLDRWPADTELNQFRLKPVQEGAPVGWWFIKSTDENIYFADCINPGISEAEWRYPTLLNREVQS